MSKSINRVQLLGNVGNDPEITVMQSGDKVCRFRLATTESWKDKASGDWKERTEWHTVVIWNQALVKRCEEKLSKGARVLIDNARIETREWQKDGQRRFATEIVLQPYAGDISLLDYRREADGRPASAPTHDEPPPPTASDYFQGAAGNEIEDEIPF